MAKSKLEELKRSHAKEIAELNEAHLAELERVKERSSFVAKQAERTAKDALKRAGSEKNDSILEQKYNIGPDISEEVDLDPIMETTFSFHDVEANPSKAISEAHEIASNLSIEIKDTIREAQELADATAVAAQAEADRVKVIAESQVEEARAVAKGVERQAAEVEQARADKIAKQNRVNKNWEGKRLLPRAEQKIAETAELAAKAAEEAKIKRSVEAEALSINEAMKTKAEVAAKHAVETAKKVGHILTAKKYKKKHKH